jgi:hypothetical protein
MQHLEQSGPVGRDLLLPQALHLSQPRQGAGPAAHQVQQYAIAAHEERRAALAVSGLAAPAAQAVVQDALALIEFGQKRPEGGALGLVGRRAGPGRRSRVLRLGRFQAVGDYGEGPVGHPGLDEAH